VSHITKRKSSMKNEETIKKAVARIKGASYEGLGSTRTYNNGSIRGHLVQLPGWKYKLAIDPATGECVFDNYNGSWGKDEHLDALKQGYAVEAAKAKAEEEGHEFIEEMQENGSIKCVIPLGGGGYEMGGDGGGDGYDV